MGTMPILPDLAGKLAKVLGMLGSEHDGEIAAAGRQANQMVRNAGLTWREVIAPAAPAPQQQYRPPRRWRRPVSAGDAAALCLQWPEVLTDWETDFCRSLVGRQSTSPRQSEVLNRITAKVEAFARSAGENSYE
jgi:hypothetical protein